MFMGILATPLQQIEAATRGALCKKMFLKISQNSQENTCAFIKKETLAQVFSCEFCQISKNNFFTEHLWTAASEQIDMRENFKSLFSSR